MVPLEGLFQVFFGVGGRLGPSFCPTQHPKPAGS